MNGWEMEGRLDLLLFVDDDVDEKTLMSDVHWDCSEMQRNLHEAHARASETEPKRGRVLGKYIYSFEKEMERPHYIMDKMWQMMQSKDTETSNLDKHFEEIINKVQHARWNESTKTKRFWTQEEDQEQVADGKHTELCCRMGLRVDVCLGKGVAVQRHSDRFKRPGLERFIRRLAKYLSEEKERPAMWDAAAPERYSVSGWKLISFQGWRGREAKEMEEGFLCAPKFCTMSGKAWSSV